MNEFDLQDAEFPSTDEVPEVETEAAVEAESDEAMSIVVDDPAVFYAAREDLGALTDHALDDVEPALKRLGPPPFVRKGFPFLGLLATIYDHVAQRVENEAEPRSGMNAPERDAEEAEED